MHPFEATLGPGPYRFLYSVEGSRTCEHCGTALKNLFIIETGDGSEHVVGSDCIKKVAEELPMEPSQAIKFEYHLGKNRPKSEVQRPRTVLKEILGKYADQLEQMPHPNAKMAYHGHSLMDYGLWALENTKGKALETASYKIAVKIGRLYANQ